MAYEINGDIPPVEPPAPPGKPGGLGEKIEATIQRAFALFVNSVRETIVKIVAWGIEQFIEIMERSFLELNRPLIESLRASLPDVPELKAYLDAVESGEHQAGFGMLAGLGTTVGTQAASSMFAPVFRILNYAMDKRLHTARFDPSQGWIAVWRGVVDEESMREHVRELGWTDEGINIWREIIRPVIGAADQVRLLRLGKISEDEFRRELVAQGYTEERINRILEITKQYPSISDLITMAVREAFNPEAISRFDLDAELPSDFVDWAEKLGMDREWARRYWIMHWRLPSISMGFDMLHRGIIDEDTLKMLIKTADISPFWRDKLIKLSYDPYTRVDVRRMYRLGILDEDDVKRAYLDLGYDEEHARNLTAYTVLEETAAERDLTRTDILRGYRVGIFTAQEAVQQLMNIGYDQEEAEYYVLYEVYKYAQDIEERKIDAVKKLYIAGLIDRGEAVNRLGKLNLTGDQINLLFSEWDIEKESKTKRLTTATIKSLYLNEIITEAQARQELSNLRYDDKYVGWLMELWKKSKEAE